MKETITSLQIAITAIVVIALFLEIIYGRVGANGTYRLLKISCVGAFLLVGLEFIGRLSGSLRGGK